MYNPSFSNKISNPCIFNTFPAIRLHIPIGEYLQIFFALILCGGLLHANHQRQIDEKSSRRLTALAHAMRTLDQRLFAVNTKHIMALDVKQNVSHIIIKSIWFQH